MMCLLFFPPNWSRRHRVCGLSAYRTAATAAITSMFYNEIVNVILALACNLAPSRGYKICPAYGISPAQPATVVLVTHTLLNKIISYQISPKQQHICSSVVGNRNRFLGSDFWFSFYELHCVISCDHEFLNSCDTLLVAQLQLSGWTVPSSKGIWRMEHSCSAAVLECSCLQFNPGIWGKVWLFILRCRGKKQKKKIKELPTLKSCTSH